MKKNQSGFSVLGIVIIVVALGLIGIAGWLVYDRQQTKPSTTPPKSANTEPAELKGTVSYMKSDTLSGWTEEHQQGSSIYSLVNSQLDCYVRAEIDRPKVDFSVEPQAGTPNREVVLGSGQKVKIYENGQSKEYFVSEGHIIKNNFNVNVTVACKDEANNSSADLGLKGIRLE